MSEPLIQTPGVFGDNGNFLLERELGSGGMGGVYMGRDKMLDRPVAVKVMLKEFGDDPEFVEKFKKEAQSVARLIHPNIAQIYSYGICNGMPYMAMELATGGSLYSIMTANKGKTDVTRVIKICQQVAQALQCASDQGYVHGDVKPENILLDSNGNAKLVDFGLAAMQKDTSEIWGTPYYISPEKVKKEIVDFRADMYSLGGTLYHALTGSAPFEGEDSIAVIKKRFEAAPKKPSELRPDLTPAIDNLVMTMLALNKEDRFPSFEALLEAFRNVLTSGLTTKLSPQAPASTASAGGGTRRMTTVRGRRMMMKRPGGTTIRKVAEGDEEEPEVNKKRSRVPADEDDEEEGGNLGAKVFGVVAGVILLVAAVIGGLVWYQIADKKSRAADEQRQISAGIEKARTAIRDTMSNARKFADEFDAFAAQAASECDKSTKRLMNILPDEVGSQLKPGPTKELLDAIAATNAAQQAALTPATTNAAEAATSAADAPAAPAVAPSIAALPKFREPTEDEKDTASPEGEAYLKAKKAFEEEQLAKLREGKGKPAEAAPAAAEPAAAPAAEKKESKNSEFEQAVIAMNDLWERAYGCQACAIRIRVAAEAVVKACEEADAIKDMTQENMDKLADLSRVVVEKYEQVKVSKDVEFVRKAIAFIRNKGAKTIEQTEKQLRILELKAKRAAAAEAAAAAEKERLERLEAERKAKIEEETAAAKAKFEAIGTQGCFRQLDWKSALRMLNAMKAEFTTPEGQLAADLEIRKVNDMKMVQDIFLKNAKGFVFKTNKLKACSIEDINEKELVLYKKGTQGKIRIPWQKFYSDYHGNLNELINTFIVNSRMPGAKFRISSLLEWSNAMTGAALTMRLVWSDVNGATERADKLVKTVVRQFSEYEKTAKEIFPDMTFDGAQEEE